MPGVPPIARIVVPSSFAVAFLLAVGCYEDERAGRCLDAVAVDLERRRAVQDDVELLLSGLAEQGLVVLSDHVDVARRPVRVGAERRDAEATADVEALPSVVRCAGRKKRRGLEIVHPRDDVGLFRCGCHRLLLLCGQRVEARIVSK